MGDRNDLLLFLRNNYDLVALVQLATEIGFTPSNSNEILSFTEELLCYVEREGMAPALLALIDREHPRQLPDLEWAGTRYEGIALTTPSASPPDTLDQVRSPLFLLREEPVAKVVSPRPEAVIPLNTEEGFQSALEDFEELRETFAAENEAFTRKPFRFVHGYSLPKHWAKREREMSELIELIRTNAATVLSLEAIGGTGKSALTRKMMDELPAHRVKLDGAFWFSFYVEPEFDRFLSEACRYLIEGFDPREHPSPYEKSVLLREAMAEGHFLLVLDGIEVLLIADKARKDFGHFQDRALREFLEGLSETTRSQILVSSRFPLVELIGKPHYRSLKLSDLSRESADELLLSLGVLGTVEDRVPIYTRFGCHALTLQVLGHYLTQYHFGDPKGIRDIQEFPDDAPQGIRLQSALDAIWQHLQPDERFFLTRMSAFRGGVDERSLIVLDRSGDNFSPEFRRMAQEILSSPLVSVERRDGQTRLTAHPLIKTFFYERMGDSERGQTHRALKDYAQGLPLPDRPRTLADYEPLLEACHHCLQVGLFTEAYQIYRRNNMDNALRWWGHYSQATALLEPLREASLGEVPTWQSERWQRSWVENETALLALLRGDVVLAVERFNNSTTMDAQSGDSQGQSASLQNLATARTQQGDIRGALAALDQSRTLEASLGRYEKEDMLAGLEGVCRSEMGQGQSAFSLLTKALGISAQRGNLRAVCYWTWRIGDLYMRAGQFETAKERFEEAIALAEREQFLDYQGHSRRGLGDAMLALGNREEARNQLTAALRLARTLGNPYLENEVRLSQARQAEGEQNLPEMRGQAEQVLDKAEQSGYQAHSAAAHLLLARYSLMAKDASGIQEHKERARQLVEATGHYVFRQELLHLK